MAENLESTLTNTSFHNWLKGALAIRFAKDGLEDLVAAEFLQFQINLLQDIWTSRQIPTGTVCGSCTTANLLVCPTQGFCKGKPCNIHDAFNEDRKENRPCPVGVCDALKDGIRRQHRFNGPSWKNTNARAWCTDAFEIAKCFLPADGYADIHSWVETDFNGIVSMIINNERFELLFAAKFNTSTNIFTKARALGSTIRHAPQLFIPDAKLASCIDDLIELLKYSVRFATDPKQQDAVHKLNQLRTNILTIHANDITQVLNDYFTESISKKQSRLVQDMDAINKKELEYFEQECKVIKEDIEKEHASVLQDLDHKKQDVIQGIEDKLQTALRTFDEECTKTLHTKVHQTEQIIRQRMEILNLLAIHLATVRTESVLTIQVIMSALREIMRKAKDLKTEFGIYSKTNQETVERRHTSSSDLKTNLVQFYRTKCFTMPISPLVNDTDAPLLDFYVPPPIEAVDLQKRFGNSKIPSKTPVNNYKQLLFRNETDTYKHIYVTAKAGNGKTSFSKFICLTWCQAHTPLESLVETFENENIEAMKLFDFVFLIFLRDVNRSLCNVDDFLLHFLKSNFPDINNHCELVETILRNNSCLIILDGFDEWKHPNTCQLSHEVNDIPHAKLWKNCTYMTTTRPWKFDVLRLPSTDVDQQIEINQFDDESSRLHAKNIFVMLQEQSIPQEKQRSIEDFHEKVIAFKLDEICKIPYVNSQVICLWHDGEEIGRSQSQIYTNIVETALQRGIQKHGVPDSLKTMLTKLIDIPDYLESNPQCNEHAILLLDLGELAFRTLFCKTRVSTLMFDKSVALRHLKSKEELTFFLNTGLLTQSKGYGHVARCHSNVMFQHKSMQEYFAAMYMGNDSTNEESIKTILEICSSLTSILEMANFFTFLCGLHPAVYNNISKQLITTVSSDEITVIYRTQMQWYEHRQQYYESIFDFQTLQVDCVQEGNRNSFDICGVYIEDIVINKKSKSEAYISTIKDTSRDVEHKIKTLSLRECESEEFHEVIETLNLLSLTFLEKLEMWTDVDQQHNVEQLLFNNTGTLRCVDIRFGNFGCKTKDHDNQTNSPKNFQIDITDMQMLQTFCLEHCVLTHDVFAHLANLLSKRNTIRQIGLGFNTCIDHEVACIGVALDLSRHTKLQCLYLVGVPISQLSVNTEYIEECEIGRLSTNVTFSCLDQLPTAQNLKKLSCASFSGDDAVRLTQLIPKLLTLESLFIIELSLEDVKLVLSPEMKRLNILWLYRVKMKISDFRELVDNIMNLLNPITVQLSDCKVTPEEDFVIEKNTMRMSDKVRVIYDGKDTRYNRIRIEFKFQIRKTKGASLAEL